jgi:hypothetical protein
MVRRVFENMAPRVTLFIIGIAIISISGISPGG